MTELGLTQTELARLMNEQIARQTGKPGTVSERNVYNLLAGSTRWPQAKTRAALEAVFGCTSVELGFTPPPGANRPVPPPEVPVRRRTFLTSGPTAAAAVAVPTLSARPTAAVSSSRPTAVGSSDVLRLGAGLRTLDELDDHRGGHRALESAALAGARAADDLQQRPASQRVRRALYALAADYTATAAWSCVDGREFDRAQQHLDRALTLAGLAGDSAIQLRLWISSAMLAYQQRLHPQALAAAQAAQSCSIIRRDPLYASLAHARTAIGHANLGDRQAALRCLGHAHDALARADLTAPHPSWLAFYGPGELHGLASIVHDHLGDPEQAEGACHRSLGHLPAQFRRNRAMVTARLALAQLDQEEIEQSCSTATQARALMDGDPLPGRLRSMLGDFHRGLITLAPDSRATREWTDRIRTEGTARP